MENKKDYLEEDQDLLAELDSIGPLSTGAALEEQKRKIEVIQVKALLKNRKSAADTEESSVKYSNALLIFACVQLIVALVQLLQSSLDSTSNQARYFGIFSVLLMEGIAVYFLFKSRK